jgi:hypothetical protein
MSNQPPSNSPDVSFEWIDEGRIAVFTLPSVARDAIDAYFQKLTEVMLALPEGGRLLSLHDFSHRSIMITPYFKMRSDEFNKLAKSYNWRSKTAILMSNTIAGKIIRLIADAVSANRGDIELRFFKDRDEALAWLRED